LEHAETLRFFEGTSIAAMWRPAPRSVEAQHLRVVHLVDVIARQEDQVPRIFYEDRIQILVHRVGGAEVPVFADALLRAEESR
jgi:hypothetical protein